MKPKVKIEPLETGSLHYPLPGLLKLQLTTLNKMLSYNPAYKAQFRL